MNAVFSVTSKIACTDLHNTGPSGHPMNVSQASIENPAGKKWVYPANGVDGTIVVQVKGPHAVDLLFTMNPGDGPPLTVTVGYPLVNQDGVTSETATV